MVLLPFTWHAKMPTSYDIDPMKQNILPTMHVEAILHDQSSSRSSSPMLMAAYQISTNKPRYWQPPSVYLLRTMTLSSSCGSISSVSCITQTRYNVALHVKALINSSCKHLDTCKHQQRTPCKLRPLNNAMHVVLVAMLQPVRVNLESFAGRAQSNNRRHRHMLL